MGKLSYRSSRWLDRSRNSAHRPSHHSTTKGDGHTGDDKENGNHPPNKPTCIYDKSTDELVVKAIDPDGDQLRYGVDWNNDMNIDQWTDLVPSETDQRIKCDGRKGKKYSPEYAS